jgi:hypothetical protein
MASFLGYRLRRWNEVARGGGEAVKWGRKTPRKVHSSANHILGLELRSPLWYKEQGWSKGMTEQWGSRGHISRDAQNASPLSEILPTWRAELGNEWEITSQVSSNPTSKYSSPSAQTESLWYCMWSTFQAESCAKPVTKIHTIDCTVCQQIHPLATLPFSVT